MSVITHVADVRSGVSYLDFEGRTIMERYMHKAKHRAKYEFDSKILTSIIVVALSVLVI